MNPKVSIIGGAGNVGVTTALRIANSGLADCVLIDIYENLAKAKQLDLEDSNAILKSNVKITASSDFSQIKDSQIVVITAGLPRKPGMTREDLLNRNTEIIKEVGKNIKNYLDDSTIIIIVTNPLDIMTYLAFKILNLHRQRVFGMGGNLDAGRFTNLIAAELKCLNSDINSMVIGSHGQDMVPLPRLTLVKGKRLNEILTNDKIQALTDKTVQRGAEIVSLQGSGSAYFGPSAAIFEIVNSILKNITLNTCASVCLEGEYGIKDVSIGVPVQINRNGVYKIIEIELNAQERDALHRAANSLKESIVQLKI